MSSLYTQNPTENIPPRKEPVLELLKVFSHDCRNDLVSMGAALALLEKGFYGTLSGKAKKETRKVSQRVGKMIGMLEDAIAQALALEGEACLQTEPVDLIKDILKPLLQELDHDIPRERIFIISHPPALINENGSQIQGNRFLLKSVLRNLIRNADAYGAKQGSIELRITQMDRYLIVDVGNQRHPITEEHQRDLFTKSGRPGSGAHRVKHGLGIGLSLVKRIVDSHGGRIWYKVDRDASHFLFSLPTTQQSQ